MSKFWLLIWASLNSNDPRMFCASLGWISPVVLEKKIFENRQCTCAFSYCCFYLLWEKSFKSVALHSTNLKAYNPRMLWSKFGWIWPNCFEEIKNVKICRQVVGQTTDNRLSEKLLSFHLRRVEKINNYPE